jgi:hypothetical protein
MCQQQDKHFSNFPLNSGKNPIRLSQFSQMPLDDLHAWRDHLLESFRRKKPGEPSYKRPFVFKDLQGRRPTLTVLERGATPQPDPPKKTASKGKSSSKKSTKKAPISPEEVEKTASESSDNAEDDLEDTKVLPRPKQPSRSASEKAARAISAAAKAEAESDAEAASKTPPTPKPFLRGPPGSSDGRLSAQRTAELRDTQAIYERLQGKRFAGIQQISMRLQRRIMHEEGTLPSDWRTSQWSPEHISSFWSSCPPTDLSVLLPLEGNVFRSSILPMHHLLKGSLPGGIFSR